MRIRWSRRRPAAREPLRGFLSAVVSGGAIVALAGCGASAASGPSGEACPAIGYVEGLRIEVVPSAPGVPDLQGCAGAVCSPVVDARKQTAGGGPDQPGPVRLMASDSIGTDWFLDLDTHPLATEVSVRLLRDGHLEQTDRFVLHWHRAAPGSRCDLHSITSPVRITER